MVSLPRPAEPGIELPNQELDRLRDHAVETGAEECCGILIGRALPGGGCRVTRAVRSENGWRGDRRHRYEVPPEALLDAMKQARREGLEVVGYYHSHPSGEARPSAFDRERAWPEVSYVIVAPRASVPIRSWRLDPEGEFREEPLVVGPGAEGEQARMSP